MTEKERQRAELNGFLVAGSSPDKPRETNSRGYVMGKKEPVNIDQEVFAMHGNVSN